MTMLEKQITKVQKDIEKAQKGIDRYTAYAEKKADICRKLGCLWTTEEMQEHRDNGEMTDKQWSAYFNWVCDKSQITEYNRALQIACRKFDKLTTKAETVEEIERQQNHIDGITNRYEIHTITEEEYEKWLAEFKAECAKDGITIENANSNFIHGLTKSGKVFAMYINNGFTDRSWHSYTLTIDGDTIFTSGLFGTGYRYLMAH